MMGRIDEFVFVLLAGLVLIIVFMFAWTAPPEKVAPPPAIKEIPFLVVNEPSEIEIKYALGVDTLDSKKNVEVAAGLLSSEEVSLVGTLSEGKLAEVRGALVDIVVESTNRLKPLIVELNGKEIYRDTPTAGSISIPVEKGLLTLKNVVTIKTEFPGLLRFWQTSKYRLEEAKLGVFLYGPAFKDFEFELNKTVVKNFKYGKLQFEVTDRVGEKNLIIKMNEQEILKGVQRIGKFESTYGPARMPLKEGKNVLSFSAEPDAEYKIKEIALTIVYGRS